MDIFGVLGIIWVLLSYLTDKFGGLIFIGIIIFISYKKVWPWIEAWIAVGNPCTSYPLYHKGLLISEMMKIQRLFKASRKEMDNFDKRIRRNKPSNETEESEKKRSLKERVIWCALEYHQKRIKWMIKGNIDVQNGKSPDEVSKNFEKNFGEFNNAQSKIAEEVKQ